MIQPKHQPSLLMGKLEGIFDPICSWNSTTICQFLQFPRRQKRWEVSGCNASDLVILKTMATPRSSTTTTIPIWLRNYIISPKLCQICLVVRDYDGTNWSSGMRVFSVLLHSEVFEWQLLITLHWDSVERPGFWCQGWFLVLLTAKEVRCFANLMDVLEKAANVFWPWNSREKKCFSETNDQTKKIVLKRWSDERKKESSEIDDEGKCGGVLAEMIVQRASWRKEENGWAIN